MNFALFDTSPANLRPRKEFMPVIVGGVVEKDGKYLLAQEAQARVRGKWNLPAGHLDPNEIIFDAAKREIKEESGLDVDLTGVCQIGNEKRENDIFVSVLFRAEPLSNKIAFDKNEILDVKWFSYDEILALGGGGHLNSESGYREFPKLLEFI